MKKKIVYHISNNPNIKVLEPRTSTHGVPYVYALDNLALDLLFGYQGMRDLEKTVGVDENGTPIITECRKGALEGYKTAVCYLYELDASTFMHGQTGWMPEVVSTQPVVPLKCTKITNLWQLMLKFEKQGKLKIVRYEDIMKTENGRDFVYNHLKDRIVRFEVLKHVGHEDYNFCKEHYPDIMVELENGVTTN